MLQLKGNNEGGADREQRMKQRHTRSICTGGFERGAVGQAVVLTVVRRLDAAPHRHRFEFSLGSVAGCGNPEKATQLLFLSQNNIL